MRTTTIVFAGTMKELRENLEQLDILFPKQTLAQIFEVTGLLKDSNVEEEQFIQTPAKKMKVTAKKLVYKNECCVCGDVWELGKKDDEFICPTCLENLMYNVKTDKLLMIVQDKIQHENFEGLNGIDACLDIQEIRSNYKALLKKY